MTLTTYLLYLAAVALLIFTPGPTILVGASNPKAVLFFAAFFPQFLNPAAPFVPQFAILALTFMAFEFTVLSGCALGVARIAPLLRSSRAVRWFNRVSGGLFTLMGGLLLLTTRRQA